jgi:6-phosphogluconolactonase (cycloisomerase 2 family)
VTANASFTGTAKPGGLASGLAVDPSGKWLIGLDVNHDLLYVLSMNPNTGVLTQAHTFPTGHRPNSVTFDDSGKFLYVSNGDYPAAMGGGSNDVSAYAFDPSTGNATQLNGSPYPAGAGVSSLIIAH